MAYVAAVMEPRWKNLSHEHSERRSRAQSAIKSYSEGKSPQPLAVVGGFRTGKTELLYHCFRYGWSQGIPALYITLKDLLPRVRDKRDLGSLRDILKNIVLEQLSLIGKLLSAELKSDQVGSLMLPEIGRYSPNPARFFEDLTLVLKAQWGDAIANFEDALSSQKAILLVDEMEEGYKELRQDYGDYPFRPVFDAIIHGETNFYLAMGFGMVSEYEILGAPEAGRVISIHIPLMTPENVGRIGEELDPGTFNFWWWLGRARPGWVVKFVDDYKTNLQEELPFLLEDLSGGEVDRVPAIDKQVISVVGSSKTNPLLKRFLLSLSPLDATGYRDVISELSDQCLVLASQELTNIEEVVDAFSADLQNLALQARSNIDINRVKVYLLRILKALSVDGQVAFGGYLDKTKIFHEGVALPLLVLVHDCLLEFEPEEEVKSTTNFLYELLQDIQKRGRAASTRLDKTLKLFREVYEPTWAQFSFKTVEALFPRPIVFPILGLTPQGGSISDIKTFIKGALGQGSDFYQETIRIEGNDVVFYFVPEESFLPSLQEREFSYPNWRRYLGRDRLYAVVPLEEVSAAFRFDSTLNPHLPVLEELHKLNICSLPEKRFQDFVSSVWYESLQAGFTPELSPSIQSFAATMGVPKATLRSIDYFHSRVSERLRELGAGLVNQYNSGLRDLKPQRAEKFPRQRIDSAITQQRITEAQILDAILLAMGTEGEEEDKVFEVLKVLRPIMEWEKVGYTRFAETFTVDVRRKRLHIGLRELREFLHTFTGWIKLQGLARRLPTDLSQEPLKTNDEIVNKETPLECILLEDHDREASLFIKAAHIHAAVHTRRDDMHKSLDNLRRGLKEQLEYANRLLADIERFNSEVEVGILLAKSLEHTSKQTQELLDTLQKNTLSSSTIELLTARLLERAIEALRDQWAKADEQFKEWEQVLSGLKDIKLIRNQIMTSIDDIYEEHVKIKESLFGRKTAVKREFLSKLDKLKQETIDKLKPVPLDIALERADVEDIITGLSSSLDVLSADLESLEDERRTLESVLSSQEQIKQRLGELHTLLS